MLEDRLLVRRLRRGNAEALCRVYDKYREDLLRLAVSLSNDAAAAEDIVHDVFISFIRGAGQFRLSGSLKAYLATCVANRARNTNRAMRTRRAAPLDEAAGVLSDTAQPDQWIVCSEELRQIARALALLPDEQREAITRPVIQGVWSCSIDRFDMARPGGVATVSVKLMEGEVADTPQDGKTDTLPVLRPPSHPAAKAADMPQDSEIATVRLRVELRPAPMDDAMALATLGLALYDAKSYEEALAIFQRREQQANTDENDRANAVIWQGHMLDLLGRRTEAIARYKAVVEMGLDGGARYDDHGLAYEFTPYATKRMTTPFIRVERLDNR